MARPLRIQYPNAWYHVTCRGNARAPIFLDDSDRNKFLALLEESSFDFGVEIHCYCLMENHFHLLVKTPLANLSRFMQRFNTAYTVFFNWHHKRSGHLFQGRYKSILVDADNYLLELSRYIHLNPVRVKKMETKPLREKLEVLNTYKWSSYQAYAYSKAGKQSFLFKDKILAMIAGKNADKLKQKKRYRDFVSRGLAKDLWNPLVDKKAHSVLGSEDFIKWVYRSFSHEFSGEREYSKINELVPSISIEVILDSVSSCFKIPPLELKTKYGRTDGGREVAIELACRYLRNKQSISEIGRQFNLSAAGIIRSRERLKLRLREDRYLEQKFNQAEEKIRSMFK